MTVALKNGQPVPAPLLSELENDAYAMKVFLTMRPSCQNRYVKHILDAKTSETQSKRVAYTLREVRKYGQRHNITPQVGSIQ